MCLGLGVCAWGMCAVRGARVADPGQACVCAYAYLDRKLDGRHLRPVLEAHQAEARVAVVLAGGAAAGARLARAVLLEPLEPLRKKRQGIEQGVGGVSLCLGGPFRCCKRRANSWPLAGACTPGIRLTVAVIVVGLGHDGAARVEWSQWPPAAQEPVAVCARGAAKTAGPRLCGQDRVANLADSGFYRACRAS